MGIDVKAPEIKSGIFDAGGNVRDYRAEQIGDVFVERVVWDAEVPGEPRGWAGPGYIWYRFWIPTFEQVVERCFAADGALLGTHVDLCAPMSWEVDHYQARDLILDLRIEPDGRVLLYNEAAFEEAVRAETLTEAEARYAEKHLRAVTAAIASDRFPPPLVRNWQVDLRRIPAQAGGNDGRAGVPEASGPANPS